MKPTRYRWALATVMFLVAFIVYMDRVNLSVATPEIMKEFGFTKIDMGYLQTMFFLGYAIMQIPGGILAEMFGHRRIVPIAVTWWSFFTALTAFTSSFTSFAVVRFLFGMGEGPVYPAMNNFISRWFSNAEKAKANSFHLAGSNIGPVFGPAITVTLMLAFGWRTVFVIFGVAGIVVALTWWILVTNTPKGNPRVNEAELAHIQAGTGVIEDKKEIAPWGTFFKSSQFWAVGIQYMIADYIMFVFLAWLPMYLMEAQGFSLQKMGLAAAFPWAAITITAVSTGFISDTLLAHGVPKHKARTWFGIGGLVLCSFSLYNAAQAMTPWMNVFWMTLSLGSLGFTFNASWTACNDIGGKFSGSVAGFMNLCGNLGGVVAPTLTAWIATHYGWQSALFFTASITIVGIIAWLMVKPDLPIIRQIEKPQGIAQ